MSATTSTSSTTALIQAADQWTALRERYAFLLEALLRLLADHPDLAPDVIQGAIENVQDVQSKAVAFNKTLCALRDKTLAIDKREDSS